MASLIGKEIGKYRITERLGQGGMAEVYAGIHTHLDRKVAIKVLHSYLLEGGDFVARFKREAKAVANLRHPNIVQVHDFDIQEDLIFMVMEYVDGVNLHTKLVEVGNRGERMPIKLIGSIINDIASALDYAHTKSMLHRDIKPSNIMIDQDNKAYLTDFGIAKLLSDQKFTATGTLVGTPAYMSPEQGRGDDLTEESDIYSLGIIAFEMLTGQVPYDAKTPIGIVHKQINDPVPNMSELVDGVPSSAQEVIDRALAKSPEGRFSSAEALVGALRVALTALESTDQISVPVEDPPTLVDDGLEAPTVTMKAEDMEQATVVMETEKKKEEPPTVEPKKKKPKVKPIPKPKGEKKEVPLWGYIAGAVGVLAIAGVILTQVIDFGQPASTTSSSAEVSTQSSSSDDDESASSDSTADEGIDHFNAGVAFFEDQRFEEAIGAFDQALAAGYINQEIYDLRGRTNRNLGNLEESVEDFTRAIEADEDIFWSWSNRGQNLVELGDLFGAIDDFRIAIEKGADHWWVFYKLGEAYYLSNEDQYKDEAHEALDQAIEMNPESYLPYWIRGDLKIWRFDNPEDALEDLNIAVELSPPGVPDAFISRGAVYNFIGDYDLCIEDNNTALEMTQENHWAFLNRGDCYASLGNIDQARADYVRLLEMVGDNPEFDWFIGRVEEWLQEY